MFLQGLAFDIGKETVKQIVSVALIGVLLFGAWKVWDNYQDNMAELDALRTYKVSVEAQKKVSEDLAEAFTNAKVASDLESAIIEAQRTHINEMTERLAREDQQVADFLDMPIPQRLRDADRQAREQRQLELGQVPH